MSETRPAATPEEAPEVTTGYHLPQRTKMLILGGAMLAMFLSSMEQTVVSTALPRIAADLNGLELFVWPFTAFMLTSVTTIPVAGRLSDIYGRKPLLLVGLVVFLGGSALCGFAQDMTQLIGFRAVQGLGAGFLMSNTMAISGDLFPPSERGKYMGVFAGIFGISALIGPPLGGFLTDELSWRWVFWINLPLGVFSVITIALFMPWIRPVKRKVQIDYLGVILLALTLVPSLLALTLVGTSASLGDPLIVALFVGSGLGLVAFMVVERRAAEPIVPLELFKNRTFRTVAIVMTGMGIGVFGVTFFLPLFVQGVIGKTATESGSIVTPQMLAIVVMAALAGQIMSRTGRYKVMALLGATLMFAGLLAMTQLNASSTLGDVVWRAILFGLGMGLIFPILMLATQNAVSQRYLGTVASANQFFQSVGGLIGVTVFGALLNSSVSGAVASRLPADLAAFADPQKLVDPTQRAAALETLGQEQFLLVAETTRNALSDAITGNFTVSVVVAALIFLALLTLKELKLRGADDHEGAEDIQAMHESESETAEPEAVAAAAFVPAPDPAPALVPAGAPVSSHADSQAHAPPALAAPVPLATAPMAEWRAEPDRSQASRSRGTPLWQQALNLRLPGWTMSRRHQAELAGALAIGSLLGLAASVSTRNGSGKTRGREPARAPEGSSIDVRARRLRRGLADRIDPPPKRRWPWA